MTATFYKRHVIYLFAAILLILAGTRIYAFEGGVIKKIKEAGAPVESEEVDALITHVPENTVPADVEYQGGHFRTGSRKGRMNRFKCSSCHNNGKVHVTGAAQMAHGDIVLDHGGTDKPLNCYTCHKKEDRDFLRSEKNIKIDMDHSYNMCGQCHFRQKKDWAGGAHGKRIGYWAGERVVMNCTSCHDPHSPRFKKRWPKTYASPDGK